MIVKTFLIGDSKAGKTGSLASLLKAGYQVRVMDFDNAAKARIGTLLKGEPEALARLDVQVCTDGYERREVTENQIRYTKLIPDATAWDKGIKLFDKWPTYGPIETWDENTVFVLDSLSFMAQAALSFILKLNNRLVSGMGFDTDIGDVHRRIREILGTLFSEVVKCNVVVITHIDYRGGSLFTETTGKGPNARKFIPDHDDLGTEKGFPMTIGKALNPIVGRYFPSLIMVKSIGSGGAMRKVICTKSTTNGSAVIELASLDPNVPAELPIETGLAEYFKAVRGEAKGKGVV